VKTSSTGLDDIKVHVKIKISALWASVMFCYIYGDYFGLYKPGAWVFYIFLGVIEIPLTALIVWYAWKWPKRAGQP
jgi:hypothetical protein